ncbi:helix-turn-helix domain-containing protein [Corynebacterium hindlerae]|uniref:helix-turn-helix domain-containing protein n=1 Tax=Corynebacterium hindlerae TaxID=699041 RepID=UPI003AAA9536
MGSSGRAPRPVTAEDRAQIVEKYKGGGYSIRSLAAEVDRSPTTVRQVLHDADIQTWTGQCIEATEARKLRANQRRLAEAEQLLDDLALIRERLWDTYEIVVNGSDGAEVVILDEPPLREQADGYRAMSTMLTTAGRTIDDVSDNGTTAAKGMLTAMIDGLNRLFEQDPDAGRGEHDQD